MTVSYDKSLCQAYERGLQCRASTTADSKWCTWHEELQAKSLKSYKRVSFELEQYTECQITVKDIETCASEQKLGEWAECLRKKWVLTNRTVQARTKHHLLFYAGGDASHQAFINNLTEKQTALETLLSDIDMRAYKLLKQKEQADWLDVAIPTGTCNEEVIKVQELLPKTGLAELPLSDEAEDSMSDHSKQDEEDVFSDVDGDSQSADSCAESCCQATMTPAAPYRSKVLAYLQYPLALNDDADRALAAAYIENIIRYIISRTPSLLVRARNAGFSSVKCFFSDPSMQEAEFGRLWRALKYSNIHREGKLSVQVLKNAIRDAEGSNQARKGASIDILGGTVWKDALPGEMSQRGYEHFYRLTSCSGCALSVTASFARWTQNRMLSQPGHLFATWADRTEPHSEQILGNDGIILCGSYRKGRSGCMEHVKPKKKGLKSVWIERDSRNWSFFRMPPTAELQERIKGLSEAKTNIKVFVWNPNDEANSKQNDSVIWISRLRSGYNANDRRCAKWTTESTFHYTDQTHERLLSTSPETCFRSGKPFSDNSLDVLVVDTGSTQDYASFMDRIARQFTVRDPGQSAKDAPVRSTDLSRPELVDRALYLGRQMFREQV